MVDFLLVTVINFAALYMMIQYRSILKKEGNGKIALFLLPHFLLLAVLNICCFVVIREDGILSFFCAAAAGTILLLETIIVFQKEKEWKEKVRRKEYMANRQLQYYARQYEALSHFQEAMRKERHERKNRNLELLTLAQSGQTDVLIQRLKEEQKLHSPRSVMTGNRTADAVLGFEQALAAQKNVKMEYNISIPHDMEVSDSVLCGVLGNALDNALEACCRLERQEDRIVRVFMKVERKNLFIEIKNRYDGTILKAPDGRLISRKKNPQEHGMGLRIIRELLEHADGNLETNWDGCVFTLRVMLYHVI